MRKTLTAAGSLAALALLAACSGQAAVPAADVAEQAEIQLETPAGERPDITCAEDLPAEVGASIECDLTDETMTETYGVTMTVTDVSEDGNVGFDIKVDEQPK